MRAVFRRGTLGTKGIDRDIFRSNFPPACCTDGRRTKRLVTRLVTKSNRRSLFIRQPLVTPFHEKKGVGVTIKTTRRQPVLIPSRSRLISRFPEEIAFDQKGETVRQRISCDVQVPLKIVEAAHAEERFLKDEKAPWVADRFQGMREWRNP